VRSNDDHGSRDTGVVKRWMGENEGEDAATPSAGLGHYAEYIRIGGVRITPDDCPDCLMFVECDCTLCDFFVPETCPLRRDPSIFYEVKAILDIYHQRQERRAAWLHRQRYLISAVRRELQAHGRPLHYVVLTRMVADRYPELHASEHSVLRAMAYRPDIFERITEGVYQCLQTG